MTYPIDLVFLDAGDVVVACRRLLPRACRLPRRAPCLEMQAGEIARLRLRPGLGLRLVPWRHLRGAASRILSAAAVFASWPDTSSQAAPPDPAGGASATVLAPLDLAQPLAVRTVQRLEERGGDCYRMGPLNAGGTARTAGDDSGIKCIIARGSRGRPVAQAGWYRDILSAPVRSAPPRRYRRLPRRFRTPVRVLLKQLRPRQACSTCRAGIGAGVEGGLEAGGAGRAGWSRHRMPGHCIRCRTVSCVNMRRRRSGVSATDGRWSAACSPPGTVSAIPRVRGAMRSRLQGQPASRTLHGLPPASHEGSAAARAEALPKSNTSGDPNRSKALQRRSICTAGRRRGAPVPRGGRRAGDRPFSHARLAPQAGSTMVELLPRCRWSCFWAWDCAVHARLIRHGTRSTMR